MTQMLTSLFYRKVRISCLDRRDYLVVIQVDLLPEVLRCFIAEESRPQDIEDRLRHYYQETITDGLQDGGVKEAVALEKMCPIGSLRISYARPQTRHEGSLMPLGS